MGRELEVAIPTRDVVLEGTLSIPDVARAIVLFAHGSGSSRYSPRNRWVAHRLQAAGLATLLMDLLSVEEEQEDQVTRRLRFDIDLLARRLVDAIDWLGRIPETRAMAVGCFGSSTGGGAALVAAALRPRRVHAVVSRGGRPDLAGASLSEVRCPTLLVVGGDDTQVIALNQKAQARMSCLNRLEIVEGATHLFEEPGTLDRVAELTAAWFTRHLTAAEQPAPREERTFRRPPGG